MIYRLKNIINVEDNIFNNKELEELENIEKSIFLNQLNLILTKLIVILSKLIIILFKLFVVLHKY